MDGAARQRPGQLGKLILRDLNALDAQALEILQGVKGAEIPDGIVVKIQIAQPLQRGEGREIHDLIPAEVQRDQPAQHGEAGDIAQGIVRHGEAVEGVELRHLVERRVAQVHAVQHQPRGRDRIVPARDAHGLRRALVSAQGLDLVNQGVGGQVFQPGSLFGLAGAIDPGRIIVAYGENYRYEPCVTRRVSLDIRSYLAELTRLWANVPTHVLTPIWHDELAWPSHAMSCHEQVPDLIATHVDSHDQMTLVEGLELLEHDPELFADGCEHPNERGCRQIATRLNAVMRVPGLRPSSVGKRRKRRKKNAKGKKAAELAVRPPVEDALQLPLEEML